MRRLFLVMLASTAVGIGSLGAVSFMTPVCLSTASNEGRWAALHFYDGRVRFFWISPLASDLEIRYFAERPSLHVVHHLPERSADPAQRWALPDSPAEGGRPVTGQARVVSSLRIGDRRAVGSFDFWWRRAHRGPVEVSLLRAPAWLPMVLLLILPIAAVLRRICCPQRGPGFCGQCGYDLTGNISGICPECGTPAHAVGR